MSTSSISAAKKRRAGNIVATPLFRSNTNNIEPTQRRVNRSTENLQNETIRQLNSSVNTQPKEELSTTDFKKPMSLQQVITVFDKRLLTLEKAIIENKVPMESQTVSGNNELNVEHTQKMMETLREDLKITLTDQSKEFDYRTNMLANEITTLKEMVIKVQSYTLEVNQTLFEERNQFFNGTENNIQIQSDEQLNDEDLEIIDNIDNISMELQDAVEEETVEQDAVEQTDDEEVDAEEETVEEADAGEADAEEADAEEADDEEEPEEPVKEKKTRQRKKGKKTCSIDL